MKTGSLLLKDGARLWRHVCMAALLLCAAPTLAEEEAEPLAPATLRELAEQADIIALVQVLDTDYEYTRDFPSGGTAFLRVLIPYKVNRQVPDIVEVYEEGLHEFECYFPNPPPADEGRRYLLMARDNPDVEGQFLGLAHGCSLTILVKRDNGYALRYPLEGLHVSDDLSAQAMPMDFADAHAVLEYEDLSVAERKALLDGGYAEEREDRTYKLTHGIELSAFRSLIGESNITRDRALLRPAPDPFLEGQR